MEAHRQLALSMEATYSLGLASVFLLFAVLVLQTRGLHTKTAINLLLLGSCISALISTVAKNMAIDSRYALREANACIAVSGAEPSGKQESLKAS